jgi:hypothetical protein
MQDNITPPGALTNVPAPDFHAARQMLRALDPHPEAQFGFRSFDDRGDDPRLAVKAFGTLDHGTRQSSNPDKDGKACRPAQLFMFMQRLGAGVFVVPNQLDGAGQRASNVVGVRTCFADADTRQQVTQLQKFIAASGLEPTVVVASGGQDGPVDKLQGFWRVEGLPVSRFRRVQTILVSRIGSDPAVIDPARVMRLTGFYHQKREPRQSRIVSVDARISYSALDFVQRVVAMPAVAPIRQGQGQPTRRGRSQSAGSVTTDRTARLRVLIDQYGGLLPSAIRALLREAVAPAEGSAGNRHSTLQVVVARLIGARWSDNDVRVLLLPIANEWGDGDWTRHLDDIIRWTRKQEDEAIAEMPAAPSAVARAFGAGGTP